MNWSYCAASPVLKHEWERRRYLIKERGTFCKHCLIPYSISQKLLSKDNYSTNPDAGDKFLRKLERNIVDEESARRYIKELYRRGKTEKFVEFIDSKVLNDISHLNTILSTGNYRCGEAIRRDTLHTYEGDSPLFLTPEPPPDNQFLARLVGNDYYLSEEGDFGEGPYSELAMHVGLAGKVVERYLLIAEDALGWRPPASGSNTNSRKATWAHVSYYDDNRNSIVEGLPSEVLPNTLRQKIGFHIPILPQPGKNHYPMIAYSATIVGVVDNIYRAKLDIFYYPHNSYWRLTAHVFDYQVLARYIAEAWPLFLESYLN